MKSLVNQITFLSVWSILSAVLASPTYSQGGYLCNVRHDIGKVVLSRGIMPGFGGSNGSGDIDCLTGMDLPAGSCIFPKGSNTTYLNNVTAWVGGVANGDTLVSGTVLVPTLDLQLGNDINEFHPHEYPNYYIVHRSIRDSLQSEFGKAISEQDLVSITTDSITDGVSIFPDFFHLRPHIPLGLEFKNSSYAWSYGYTEDIIFFEWVISNIGKKEILDAFVGVETAVAVSYLGRNILPNDDLGGFIKVIPSILGCEFKDSIVLAWNADNDGDPVQGEFVNRPTMDPITGDLVVSCKNVSAVELIDAPINFLTGSTISYNWWHVDFQNDVDFGPRHRENFRNFWTGGGLGAPYGDVNQYYIMGNGEIDYDPAFAASIKPFDLNWMYPDQPTANDISIGTSLTQLLSLGEMDIAPGNEVRVVLAFVLGENFHTDPNNLQNLPDNPNAYYSNLDFSDLTKNAQIAKWVYDNPGIDTDGDGYAGEFRVCVLDSALDSDSNWYATAAETTYYKGDGVPDWRPALPPPAPKLWVTPTFRGIHIRFNGHKSETSKDIFTQLNDFEGYRIYLGRDNRVTSFSRLATYDIENYDKYIWNYEKQPEPGWELLDFPSPIEEIRCKYALSCDDSTFDPLSFRSSRPYSPPLYPESLFYWEKHESNVDEFGVTTDIEKIYPNARDPRLVPADSLNSDDFTYDGYYKFFDYEYTIENILPTVPYYVSVTALDFGWPKSGVEPLESSVVENAQEVFASVIDSNYSGKSDQVVVYPNPYRNDQSYRARGFEGLGNEDRSNERVRRIHFANLPPKCKIKIFSLDGDLVREIHHDKDPNDPASSHAEWGLISRNGLAVVSGLYYWVVEFPNGETQIGKLVIIL